MMHRAWSSIVEVPYCFSRSYVKFQGHTALKIFKFDPNWAFPDCNSSFNSPMALKCCTKLETAKERCPIVFQGHPSNFKVTWDKTSQILTQIGRFRTIGRSQLSNPSDLPCFSHGLCLGNYWKLLLDDKWAIQGVKNVLNIDHIVPGLFITRTATSKMLAIDISKLASDGGIKGVPPEFELWPVL